MPLTASVNRGNWSCCSNVSRGKQSSGKTDLMGESGVMLPNGWQRTICQRICVIGSEGGVLWATVSTGRYCLSWYVVWEMSKFASKCEEADGRVPLCLAALLRAGSIGWLPSVLPHTRMYRVAESLLRRWQHSGEGRSDRSNSRSAKAVRSLNIAKANVADDACLESLPTTQARVLISLFLLPRQQHQCNCR